MNGSFYSTFKQKGVSNFSSNVQSWLDRRIETFKITL